MTRRQHAFVVATHATAMFGSPDACIRYLRERVEWLIVLKFPLLSRDDSVQPSYEVFHSGCTVDHFAGERVAQVSTRSYVADIWHTILWTRRLVTTYKLNPVFIGCDNLLALAGLSLRQLQCVERVIFYSADYSEHRFTQPIINSIYRGVDLCAARFADSVWSNTERTRRIRTRQGVSSGRNVLVPNGVFLDNLVTGPLVHDSDTISIEYHGSLTETKGLQYVLAALAQISYTNFTFHIIGTGPYESSLHTQVSSHPHRERILFLGHMSNGEVISRLPTYDLSIALMSAKEDYVRYCDPIKVKEALACGVPVLVSSVPEIADLIGQEQLGIVISQPDNSDAIATLLQTILASPRLLATYKENVRRVRGRWDWNLIYDNALAALEAPPNAY